MGAVAAAQPLAQGTLRTQQVDKDHGQARGDQRWLEGDGLGLAAAVHEADTCLPGSPPYLATAGSPALLKRDHADHQSDCLPENPVDGARSDQCQNEMASRASCMFTMRSFPVDTQPGYLPATPTVGCHHPRLRRAL